jgi:DNA primase large subunit
VYEINVDKLKEKSHKSAWIVLCMRNTLEKLKENSHKSAYIVLCIRET